MKQLKETLRVRLSVAEVLALFVLVLVFNVSALSQQNVQSDIKTVSNPSSSLDRNWRDDDHYRIGPGDVLEVRFYNRPQLSGPVRVSMNGTIQLPLIEGEVRAACRTEEELSKDVATLYLKYLKSPYVTVLVKEYSSTPVAVVGAVDKPGRFQLTRRIRLLELLAYAGGPTDKAGGQIVIAHLGGQSLCSSITTKDSDTSTAAEPFSTYG